MLLKLQLWFGNSFSRGGGDFTKSIFVRSEA